MTQCAWTHFRSYLWREARRVVLGMDREERTRGAVSESAVMEGAPPGAQDRTEIRRSAFRYCLGLRAAATTSFTAARRSAAERLGKALHFLSRLARL